MRRVTFPLEHAFDRLDASPSRPSETHFYRPKLLGREAPASWLTVEAFGSQPESRAVRAGLKPDHWNSAHHEGPGAPANEFSGYTRHWGQIIPALGFDQPLIRYDRPKERTL